MSVSATVLLYPNQEIQKIRRSLGEERADLDNHGWIIVEVVKGQPVSYLSHCHIDYPDPELPEPNLPEDPDLPRDLVEFEFLAVPKSWSDKEDLSTYYTFQEARKMAKMLNGLTDEGRCKLSLYPRAESGDVQVAYFSRT